MRRLGEKIEEFENYILYHKGETAGQRGVGFLIKQTLKPYILEIRGISDRLAVLNIKFPGYTKSWSIIQVYAPTEIAESSVLEAFYREMSQTIINNSDKHIILMGDFNAQVGARQNNNEYILGNFGYGKRSCNGQKLVEFLMEHNFSVLSSHFKKNKHNKWTWISPDGSYKNEIDYIISNYPQAFTDTSVISNLNFNTNHRMVRSALKMTPTKSSRKHISKSIIKQPQLQSYTNNKKTLFKELNNKITNEKISITQKYNILERELQNINIASVNKNKKSNKYQLSEH